MPSLTSTTLKPSKPKRVYTEEQKLRKAAYAKTYEAQNRDYINARHTKWKQKNPTKVQSYCLKNLYGITLEQRDAMLLGQGAGCAICTTSSPGKKGWVVDHCHATEKVRGVLCHPCNLMLGMAKDSPATLAAAITYLGK